MQIDHIFLLSPKHAFIADQLKAFGLRETYRRVHPGQGTENICYCFDNLFLELLWVTSEADVQSPLIARTGLYERWRGGQAGACPFGIAWRADGGETLEAPQWDFRPPYLPAGLSIKIAEGSKDPLQPLVFESPGTMAPIDWPLERRGQLQHGSGWGSIDGITITPPANHVISPVVAEVARKTFVKIAIGEGHDWLMSVSIVGRNDAQGALLHLPPL